MDEIELSVAKIPANGRDGTAEMKLQGGEERRVAQLS